MGTSTPTGKAQARPHVSTCQHLFRPFPSPASVHDSLNTPTLESSLKAFKPSPSLLSPRYAPLDAAGTIPSQPGDVKFDAVVTPPANDMREPDMNLVVGGALAPSHSTLPPRPPPRRSNPGLRLPAFDLLGIAVPAPEGYGLDGVAYELDQQPASSRYEDSAASEPAADTNLSSSIQGLELSHSEDGLPGGRAVQSPLRRTVDTLTPPAEAGCIDWNATPKVLVAMDSPETDHDNAPSQPPNQDATQTDASPIGQPSQLSTPYPNIDDKPAWIRGAIHMLVNNLHGRAGRPGDSLRVISHALPSPSPTGHIFSEVLGAISSSTPGSVSSPMTWINVFHAIPGKFNLQDLPRSPPATPGPAIGGEDYFTEKVFDSAVSITDYQQDLSELPRSPCPVVPPGSINVSIVERYIPPSTANEIATMFDTNGPSILIDRLIELSPDNGSLLFIYPTRTGAATFMREYLSPILDPILRSLAVVQGFSADLNRTLGSMVSVHQLLEHENLHHRMAMLCDRLTQHSSVAERFNGRRPHLTLSHASKEHVSLSRDAWARDWWTKQEKPRIREAITKHCREAQKISRIDHNVERKSASELWQALLADVEKKTYGPGQEPEHGIEVSVFVITRSS